MSNRGSRGLPANRYERESRHRKMPLDLNALPASDSRDQEGTSAHGEPQEHQVAEPALIDVDAVIDDDVLISSPRAFAEAKSKANGNRRRTLVHDVESGEQNRVTCNNRNKRSRVPPNQTIINCDLYINLEGSSNSMRQDVMPSRAKAQPPPPPNNPTFCCPICMGQLVEEMSTKCGHIFCKKCIKAAISSQSKCPTCRKKITMKDTIRIYLPATN